MKPELIVDYCNQELIVCEAKLKKINESKSISLATKSYAIENVKAQIFVYKKLINKAKEII